MLKSIFQIRIVCPSWKNCISNSAASLCCPAASLIGACKGAWSAAKLLVDAG